MTTTSAPITAFFGATGGCACNALSRTLKDGHRAIALARTPSKLTDMLKAEPFSVPQKTLDANLTIVEGSVTDVNTVKKMFANEPVNLIVSGLGSLPSGVKLSFSEPVTMQQPTICTDSMNTIFEALQQLSKESENFTKPYMVAISTTGVAGVLGESHVEDVPFVMAPLYHWALKVPHKDKNNMEVAIATEAEKTDSVISGFTIMRPTLLRDGPGNGLNKTKSGWRNKEKEGPGPAKGFLITKEDVGNYIYETLIKDGKFAEWNGRVVTLTN